jgi:hypothetical protein
MKLIEHILAYIMIVYGFLGFVLVSVGSIVVVWLAGKGLIRRIRSLLSPAQERRL